jgi:hypothetical protein
MYSRFCRRCKRSTVPYMTFVLPLWETMRVGLVWARLVTGRYRAATGRASGGDRCISGIGSERDDPWWEGGKQQIVPSTRQQRRLNSLRNTVVNIPGQKHKNTKMYINNSPTGWTTANTFFIFSLGLVIITVSYIKFPAVCL